MIKKYQTYDKKVSEIIIKKDKKMEKELQDNKKKTKKYMKEVRKYLKEKYGKIESSWEGNLNLLETNYNTILNYQFYINRDGLMVLNKYNKLDVNPAVKGLNDAQVQFQKLSSLFGLSPYAKAKIKNDEKGNTGEDDLFIQLNKE